MARAKHFTANKDPQSLSDYAAAHNIEEELNTALNTIASAQPSAPERVLADLLGSRSNTVTAATLPSAPPIEALESLRYSWLVLHGMHKGVCT